MTRSPQYPLVWFRSQGVARPKWHALVRVQRGIWRHKEWLALCGTMQSPTRRNPKEPLESPSPSGEPRCPRCAERLRNPKVGQRLPDGTRHRPLATREVRETLPYLDVRESSMIEIDTTNLSRIYLEE